MLRSGFFGLLSLCGACCVAVSSAQTSAQTPAQTPAQTSVQTSAQASSGVSSADAVAVRHSSSEWMLVSPHLPDPVSASAASLEMAGDVLRARRLPDDAIDYYGYAMARGGDEVVLMNKMGVTQLGIGRPELARASFKKVLALKRKDAQAWNNLGATENVAGNLHQAVADYQRAVKLNRKDALYHANLGTAYFALQDYESARQQIEIAIRLDEAVFQRGGLGGTRITVLSADDRGRFAFEMARMAAEHGQDDGVMHWLGAASEAGYDLRIGMAGRKEFEGYVRDPRVAVMIQTAKTMRTKQVATDVVPLLPEAR